MKSILSSVLLLVLFSALSMAQVPRGFNYQAIARDASGAEIASIALDVRIAILSSLSPEVILWEEQHSLETNDYGLLNLVVGDPAATRIAGMLSDFEDIDWMIKPLFLKTRIYYQNNWLDLGSNMLMSVPYSKVAERAVSLAGIPLMMNGDTAYFMTNLSVATSNRGPALAVIGNELTSEDALFEVRRSDGEVVFGVYNDGVEINVPYSNSGKGPKGGFAIGGFNPSKKGVTEEYFRVTRDSTRVYVNQAATTKGPKGGFAIGGFNPSKAEPVDFMNMTYKNYLIGQNAGESITTGEYNAFFGYQAGMNVKTGSNNVFIGHQSGYNNDNTDNVMIGNRSGYANTGYNNIFVGFEAGRYSSSTTNTTFLGNYAGYNMIGDDNIAIGDNAGRDMNLPEGETYESYGTVVLGIDAGRNVGGNDNTFLGYGAGSRWGGTSGTGSSNTFIGAHAGAGSTQKLGLGNVCIGYRAGYEKEGDNQLYIANDETSTLIYGQFAATGNPKVEISGDLNAVSVVETSDSRFKTNIETLGETLPALVNISGIYYNWNTMEYPDAKFSSDRQIGLLAQEVEKFFPELVSTDKDGYKSLSYGKMTAVLLQAIKEQQVLIEDKDIEISNLNDRVSKLENRLLLLESLVSGEK